MSVHELLHSGKNVLVTRGSFRCVVPLPDTAHLDKAEAGFKNGVLMLSGLKKAGAQLNQRKIEIKQAA